MKKPNKKQFMYHMVQIYYGYFRNEGFPHEIANRNAKDAAIMMVEFFFGSVANDDASDDAEKPE